MKRVLKITATDGATTARVRIEVDCRDDGPPFYSTRRFSRLVLNRISDGVMQTLMDSGDFRVPLSRQRVGR